MEENRLNIDELKQVSGGRNVKGFKSAAVIIKSTDYYKDRNKERLGGRFYSGDEVWVTGSYQGRYCNMFYVVAREGNKEGYVPEGTVQHDSNA